MPLSPPGAPAPCCPRRRSDTSGLTRLGQEGVGLLLKAGALGGFRADVQQAVAAVLVAGGLKDFKKLIDAGEVGGTPLLRSRSP